VSEPALTLDPTPGLILHVGDGSEAASRNRYISYECQDVPSGTQMIEQFDDIGGGLRLRSILYGNHLFVTPESDPGWNIFGTMVPNDGEPIVRVNRVGTGHTKLIERKYAWYKDNQSAWSYRGGHKTETRKQEDCYIPGMGEGYDQTKQFAPDNPKRLPYVYVEVNVWAGDQQVIKELRFQIPRTGKVAIDGGQIKVTIDALGVYHTLTENFADDGEYSTNPLEVLYRHLNGSEIKGGADALWTAFLALYPGDAPMDGLASLYKRKAFRDNFARLEGDAPLDWAFLRWLQEKTTVSGRKGNQLISAMFTEVADDYDKLLAGLRAARANAPSLTSEWRLHLSGRGETRTGIPARMAICMTLPGAAEKVQDQAAKKDFRLRKTAAGQAEGLGLDDRYPLLRAAVEAGHIKVTIFNQPGQDGQPVNREFALWERALKQKGWAKPIYEICASAANRGTYERDITPYLNSLFTVPAYLDKHTEGRKKWSGFPKFVNTETELEMDNDDDDKDGPQKTRKERSAFTPQVDNDTRVVTIPYVAVCVTGLRTQWCYSRNYYVFEAGFTDPETGGIVVNDFEPNLNGQGDDYGLMYFTLTGTDTARGYPTFLIIFERRDPQQHPDCICNTDPDCSPMAMGRELSCRCKTTKGTTFVHFHRVRPCRSANGVKTPACELIERCYQYMAGNVPATDVTAQQGDLLFIKHGNDPIAAKAKVHPNPETGPSFEFESHRFVSDNPDVSLTMHRSAAKTPRNRMGFMWAPNGLSVRHPEHDDIEGLEEGWYEIRRCKSYENNPVGIWSLTID